MGKHANAMFSVRRLEQKRQHNFVEQEKKGKLHRGKKQKQDDDASFIPPTGACPQGCNMLLLKLLQPKQVWERRRNTNAMRLIWNPL